MISWLLPGFLNLLKMFVADTYAHSVSHTNASPTRRAESAFNNLDRWYNVSTGTWDSTGWWNNANIITMVGNLARADPENDQLQLRARVIFALAFRRAPATNPQLIAPIIGNGSFALFKGTNYPVGNDRYSDAHTHEPHTLFPLDWHAITNRHLPNNPNDLPLAASSNPEPWLNGYYDDNLWWSLAWISAYDLTQQKHYLHLAQNIFLAMTNIWPTHCHSGGIYWSWERNYVNAITNELFFSTAAHLANRAHKKSEREYFFAWAERALEWFDRSGMINAQGTINDGLTEECVNNNGTVWSYNQGVILGGLVEMHRATAQTATGETYLSRATRIAHAALRQLSDADGVLHDPCEPNCGADGTQFKGVFMRGLQELQKVAPDEVFRDAIRRSAESVWWHNREDGVFSVNWAGPFIYPANASTHSSAMEALVADLAVG
ncbi:glycosyl hydrolase family 76-domain-containing protein [Paraphoma chrysanthemicola]|uniref:Glycosyl hydrolase family 76-domain-containing protein n=1 Tax=Paraphoma chrysanthemicola TaxID=798071 RepID=A0A8K0RFL3_9PLEO|nr:glycosyl hydrolase family 76-domain-containing protein [Paraphoma chrysanthemicola]